MTTFRNSDRRELAHRISDGIEATPSWLRAANAAGIEVLDSRTGELLAADVEQRTALEAFNHPYDYAATPARSGLAKQTDWLDDRPLP
jgi:hypothetical protein